MKTLRFILLIIGLLSVSTLILTYDCWAGRSSGGGGGNPFKGSTGGSSAIMPATKKMGDNLQSPADADAQIATPPGITKMGEIPGNGLHKGWQQGKHLGWDKEDQVPELEPEPPEPPEPPEFELKL